MSSLDKLTIEEFSESVHGSLINELTEMLHSAYRPLAEAGMRYLATHQPPEITLKRLNKGRSFLGFIDGELVSTITLVGGGSDQSSSDQKCSWYRNPEVTYFTQFAVKPKYQRSGIGRYLMDFVENLARQQGAKEIALDTSERASHLIGIYGARNYRQVETVQWGETNYLSVILSKNLEN